MSNRPMIDRYRWYEYLAIYAGMALFLTFVLAPFVEGFLVSLKPLTHLFSSPYRFWPDDGSFEAYVTMWEHVPLLGRYIFNSLLISTVATLAVLILVVPAAYAFARFRFPGAGALLGAFLAVNMFSGAVLLIPLYRLMRSMGLLNTYFAMIVPGVAFLIPSAIWLLRTYMLRIPRELDEAAWVDGAGRLGGRVAAHAARKRELSEQLLHAFRIARQVGIELGVAAFEPRVCHERRASVAGPGDVDHVEVMPVDDAIEMGVNEIQSGRGPPVTEQSRLHMPGLERLAQQRVVEQIDLPDRQVIRRTPPGVDASQLVGRQGHGAGSSTSMTMRTSCAME